MSDSRPSQTSIARRDGSRPGPRRWFAVAACAALLLTASTGAATAASGARGNVHVPYLGQTERAGLTQAQAAALQRKIDRYMAQLGGTQVSANRIDWADGHMVVAVPGERLDGFELLGGSWWNNQTAGIRARMYNKSYTLVYTTPPAGDYSYDPTGDWGPVWYVKAC